MEASIKTRVRLFGAFREVALAPELEVWVSEKSTVKELKSAFAEELKKQKPNSDWESLVRSSALADETSVLQDQEVLGDRRSFAILPPVCGG